MATAIDFLTADQIRDLMAHLLKGAAGGTEAGWRKAIGTVEQLPAWRHVRFNWRVTPTGSERQRELIEKAIEVVRGEHPYIVTSRQ